MELGNKILQLRKQHNLSQEQLAEKMNVTRQTISKWELGETSPDIRQAKELSKIFNVSLDELVDNQIKDVLVVKIDNTEKLIGLVLRSLKVVICILLVSFIVVFAVLFLKSVFPRSELLGNNVDEVTISCSIDDDYYLITIASDAYFTCSNCKQDIQLDLRDMIDYSNIDWSAKNIVTYFNNKNGICEKIYK